MMKWRCRANEKIIFNLYLEAVGRYATDELIDSFKEDDAARVVEAQMTFHSKLKDNMAMFATVMLPVEDLCERFYEDEIAEALRVSLSEEEREKIRVHARTGELSEIEKVIREHIDRCPNGAFVRAIVAALARAKMERMGK